MKLIAAASFAHIAPGVFSDAAAADRPESTVAVNFEPSDRPEAINGL